MFVSFNDIVKQKPVRLKRKVTLLVRLLNLLLIIVTHYILSSKFRTHDAGVK